MATTKHVGLLDISNYNNYTLNNLILQQTSSPYCSYKLYFTRNYYINWKLPSFYDNLWIHAWKRLYGFYSYSCRVYRSLTLRFLYYYRLGDVYRSTLGHVICDTSYCYSEHIYTILTFIDAFKCSRSSYFPCVYCTGYTNDNPIKKILSRSRWLYSWITYFIHWFSWFVYLIVKNIWGKKEMIIIKLNKIFYNL